MICIFYFTGALCARTYLKFLSGTALRAMRWTIGLGLLVHLSLLFSNAFTIHLVTSVVLSAAGFFLTFRRSWIFLAVILYPLVIAILILSAFMAPMAADSADLPSPWLWIHILLMLVGEAFFLLAAVVSILYLIADHQLRRKQLSNFHAGLPSLSRMDSFLSECLWAGFTLLSVGMAIGFMFAKQFWEVGWLLDPKVLFCVLTWFVYAFLLSMRGFQPSFRGRRSAIVACIGLLAVIFLAWGVEMIFPSQHINFKLTQMIP